MEKCIKCSSKNIELIKFSVNWDVYSCTDCEYWTYKKSETCCDSPHEVVTIEHKSNGTQTLYYQCLNCGNCPNRTKPLSQKKYSDKIRYEFSTSYFEEKKNQVELERQELSKQKSIFYYINSSYYKYQQYLSSDEWKSKREQIFKRDKNKCQKCLKETATEVHHLNYDNLFNEKLSDLLAVCYDCHRALHKD